MSYIKYNYIRYNLILWNILFDFIWNHDEKLILLCVTNYLKVLKYWWFGIHCISDSTDESEKPHASSWDQTANPGLESWVLFWDFFVESDFGWIKRDTQGGPWDHHCPHRALLWLWGWIVTPTIMLQMLCWSQLIRIRRISCCEN